MNGRQIHLLVLRSSCPTSSIPLLILVRGRVHDEPGGGVSFLSQNKTEGLMYLPQNNDDGVWDCGRQLLQSGTILMKTTRGEGARLVDVSILDWIQCDVD